MKTPALLSSALIGAVASARSMTPMATLATARLAGRRTPGRLVLLDHPLFEAGALAMGVGELLGDKMKTAPEPHRVPGTAGAGDERGHRRRGPGAARAGTGRSDGGRREPRSPSPI